MCWGGGLVCDVLGDDRVGGVRVGVGVVGGLVLVAEGPPHCSLGNFNVLRSTNKIQFFEEISTSG